MSNKGWIKLDRQIQNHWIWIKEKPFSFGQAWIDLIMMANHKPSKFPDGNEIKEIQRGSLVTSQKKLMERWGWGISKLRRFLNLLENDNMIVKKPNRNQTIICIVNYSFYQHRANHNQTTNESQVNQERIASKNIQEYKEDTTYLRMKESAAAQVSPSAEMSPQEIEERLRQARERW